MNKFKFVATTLAALTSMALAAAEPQLIRSDAMLAKQATELYIIQMRERPAVAYEGETRGFAATKPQKGKRINPNSAHVKKYTQRLDSSHDQALASVGASSDKVYDYRYSFNGFAARLTSVQVEELKNRADVVRVWANEIHQPTTDTSPDFLNLSGGGGAWSKGYTGEDIIIGVIDSGIWPEHPSLADEPTAKKGNKGPGRAYDGAPDHWNGTACEFGNAAFNPNDAQFECNGKLLGAQFYNASFPESVICGGGLNCGWTDFLSARDKDGHGTHTATTAGGNNGVQATLFGENAGVVSGIAPRARIAAYKVCWNGSLATTNPRGCGSVDSMMAIDQAVADGVDVINYSIGGPSTNFGGASEIAFLFAADAGVWVATAAGNAGPDPETVGTPSGVPWVTAVGAAQDDNVFILGADINSSDSALAGTYEALEAAISVPLSTTGPIVGELSKGDPLDGCAPLTDAINGIALIQRGGCAFSTKFLNSQAAGAQALIVFNNEADPIVMGGDSSGIAIPGVMIGQADGEAIAAALLAGDSVVATLDPAITISKMNTIATFSSRGANAGERDVIKPDIAAPGVDILAGNTPDTGDFAPQGELFQVLSGTSMASPHVAGLFALLKQAHPGWSAATARSAIMTTARQNINKAFGDNAATPFDIGAGHIVPNAAFDPGLAYDAGTLDYIQYLCGSNSQTGILSAGLCDLTGSIDPSNLNLPSIGIASLAGTQTVTRTVTNVANNNGNKSFTVSVEAPTGIDVSVSPTSIKLKPGQSATYEVTFRVIDGAATLDEWTFGSLTWSHGGKYAVRSPIAVKPVSLAAPEIVTTSGADSDGSASYDVSIGYTGPFAADPLGLVPAEVQSGAVGVGDATLHFVFVPPGTRVAKFALFDESVGDGTGSDDLDMQVQGPDSAGFPFVAFSGSGTSQENIDLVDPAPGVYAVFVIHFAAVNPETPYALHFWDIGPDLGNMTLDAPASVVSGTQETITVNWSTLDPATKYRGAVLHSNATDELGLTLIQVDSQ